MSGFLDSRFWRSVLASLVASGLYGLVIVLANQVFDENWPWSAWVAVGIMATTLVGALVLQREERRRLEAKLAHWDGIEITGLCEFEAELDRSDDHPREQLDTITFSLDFMGHGGSKWTGQEAKMRQMLSEVGNARQKARMLLLNPASTVCISASQSREGSNTTLPTQILRSLRVLDRLKGDFPHLEFRLYEHTPFFRLTFVDERAVIVGHYKQYRENSAKSPLMVWEREQSNWSFYQAFSKYFENEWDSVKPLAPDELDDLEEKIKTL
jgi:hypothetical protein